jgi:hypothetical protein
MMSEQRLLDEQTGQSQCEPRERSLSDPRFENSAGGKWHSAEQYGVSPQRRCYQAPVSSRAEPPMRVQVEGHRLCPNFAGSVRQQHRCHDAEHDSQRQESVRAV